jgi:hypothetical protein
LQENPKQSSKILVTIIQVNAKHLMMNNRYYSRSNH